MELQMAHAVTLDVCREDPGREISEVLQKLTEGFALYFPGEKERPKISSVQFMGRRLSDIARVELCLSRSYGNIYVKLHKNPKAPLERVHQKARLEFDTLSYLYEKFRNVPECSVARPIAFFPEEMAVVTEEGEGKNLHQLIKRKAGLWCGGSDIELLTRHCRASGVWLRHFQEITAQQRQEALPVSDLLGHVRTDLEECVAIGLPRADSIRLVTFCEDQLRRVEGRDFSVVGIHPDFQPDNVLVSPAGVTVMDFTSFQYGSIYNDVARFLASLDFLTKNPLYSRAKIQNLMAAFLRGYGWSQNELSPALTVYLVRSMVRASRSVSSWSANIPLKRLVEHRTASFLSAWSRRIISSGDGFVSALTLPSP
jgi:thiamine kinase-like enzyme